MALKNLRVFMIDAIKICFLMKWNLLSWDISLLRNCFIRKTSLLFFNKDIQMHNLLSFPHTFLDFLANFYLDKIQFPFNLSICISVIIFYHFKLRFQRDNWAMLYLRFRNRHPTFLLLICQRKKYFRIELQIKKS